MTTPPPPRAWRVLVPHRGGQAGRELRRWVTPEELNVAPGLLGMPLARPGRRLLAMGVDLAAIGLVSSWSNFWLLAALCAWLGERAWSRRHRPSPVRTVIVALLVAWMAYTGVQEAVQDWRAGPTEKAALSEDEADEVDEAVVGALLAPAAISAALPAASAAAGDTPASAASAPDAAATIAALTTRLHTLQSQLQREHRAAEEAARAGHWRARLRQLGLDFGIGYGWALVYFTLLPTWWKGQTLGKRLFHLRVCEITGKPATAFLNLKRFGGYLAGMATGGLGLAQAAWDANRQGLQDKAAHTVVVDERAPRRPPPPPAPPPPPPPVEEIVSPS